MQRWGVAFLTESANSAAIQHSLLTAGIVVLQLVCMGCATKFDIMKIINKLAVSFLLSCTFAMANTSVHAESDQVSLPNGGRVNINNPDYLWEQEVQAGISGRLDAVSLHFDAEGGARFQPILFSLRVGGQGTAPDYETTLMPSQGWVDVDVSSTNLIFSEGQTFIFSIQGTGPTVDCCIGSASSRAYLRGNSYFTGSDGVRKKDDVWDMAFKTYVSAIPEPSTYMMWIVGLGLLGAVLRRK